MRGYSDSGYTELQRRGNYQITGYQPKSIVDVMIDRNGDGHVQHVGTAYTSPLPMWPFWGGPHKDRTFNTAGNQAGFTKIRTSFVEWEVGQSLELNPLDTNQKRVVLDNTAKIFCKTGGCDYYKKEYDNKTISPRWFRVEEELHIDGPIERRQEYGDKYVPFLWGHRKYKNNQPGGLGYDYRVPIQLNDTDGKDLGTDGGNSDTVVYSETIKYMDEIIYDMIYRNVPENQEHAKITKKLKSQMKQFVTESRKCSKPVEEIIGKQMCEDIDNCDGEMPTCSTSPYLFRNSGDWGEYGRKMDKRGYDWFECLSMAETMHYDILFNNGRRSFEEKEYMPYASAIEIFKLKAERLGNDERPGKLFYKITNNGGIHEYGINGFTSLIETMRAWKKTNSFVSNLVDDSKHLQAYKKWANKRRLQSHRRRLDSMDSFSSLAYFSHMLHYLGIQYSDVLKSEIGRAHV